MTHRHVNHELQEEYSNGKLASEDNYWFTWLLKCFCTATHSVYCHDLHTTVFYLRINTHVTIACFVFTHAVNIETYASL